MDCDKARRIQREQISFFKHRIFNQITDDQPSSGMSALEAVARFLMALQNIKFYPQCYSVFATMVFYPQGQERYGYSFPTKYHADKTQSKTALSSLSALYAMYGCH